MTRDVVDRDAAVLVRAAEERDEQPGADAQEVKHAIERLIRRQLTLEELDHGEARVVEIGRIRLNEGAVASWPLRTEQLGDGATWVLLRVIESSTKRIVRIDGEEDACVVLGDPHAGEEADGVRRVA